MSYIGQAALKNSELKRFDVTSSTSATHVLSWTAPNEQSLWITINGVKQQDDAYTIAGSPTTITLSSALVSADKMEVIGILDIGEITVVGDNSVSAAKLADNAVTTAKIFDNAVTAAKIATDAVGTAEIAANAVDTSEIAANAVTLAEMAGLVRGKLIVGDASGDPSALTVGTADQVLQSDGTDAAWVDLSTGTSWQAVKTAAFTAVAGNGYPINTTSAALTVTLPAAASVGDTIEFVDYAGTWATNNVIIDPNGLKLKGDAANSFFSLDRLGVRIVYVDATQGWVAVSARDDTILGGFVATGGTTSTHGSYTVHTFTSSGNFVTSNKPGNIDVLVVAGGGSGGGRHGGGGGGGGVVKQTALSVAPNTYAVVIGGGASAPSPVYGGGTNGSNTTAFSLTAIGGGGGGTYPSPLSGIAGGGGGGGTGDTPNAPGGTTNQQSSGTPTNAPSNITAYGFAGGIGYHGPSDGRMSGGGGGAGAVGGTGGVNAAPYVGGAGGIGHSNDFYDGTALLWAAGGGGGMWGSPSAGPGGAGGQGGGGGGGSYNGPGGAGGTGGLNDGTPGVSAGTTQGNPAGANTGSGGGGAGQGNWGAVAGGGGAGGSGCVVIRYLT